MNFHLLILNLSLIVFSLLSSIFSYENSEPEKSLQYYRTVIYHPKQPYLISGPTKLIEGKKTYSISDSNLIQTLFPNIYGKPLITFELSKSEKIYVKDPINIGIIFCDGQAPGSHNIISGLYDNIKSFNINSEIFGFLNGFDGLINHKYIQITSDLVNKYRNTGGIDLIGTSRYKLEEINIQDKNIIDICYKLKLKALVIIGNSESIIISSIMAEYFLKKNIDIQIIGIPKSINGDFKNEFIETSLGFDTATKLYSELIGNIEKEAINEKNTWHFITLMGNNTSHITLECALKTQPNIAIIGEEIYQKKIKLTDIIDYIINIIKKRAELGKNYGVILIPEGLNNFIPELNDEINMSGKSNRNILAEMVINKLKQEKYNKNFIIQKHFFGYEGRSCAPSNFDADYAYALGKGASLLIKAGKTGYISYVKNLVNPFAFWIVGGIPFTTMMNIEKINGKIKPLIKKTFVRLDDRPFKIFENKREEWAINDKYKYPGPILYWGPSEIVDATTETLKYEQNLF